MSEISPSKKFGHHLHGKRGFPLLPCRLVTPGEYDEWPGLVMHKFSSLTFFRGQGSPVNCGKVAKVYAPATSLGGVQFACVYGEVRHKQGTSGFERKRDWGIAGFHVLLHTDV